MKFLTLALLLSYPAFARDASKTLKGIGDIVNDSAELADQGLSGGAQKTDEVVNAAKKPVHKPHIPGEEKNSPEYYKVQENQPKKPRK